MRLILDTSVLVAFERGDLRPSRADDDLAIPGVVLAEFATGAARAGTPEERRARELAADAVVSGLALLDYTAATAFEHARLLAAVQQAGRPRAAHHLIIAAHAVETGRQVATLDRQARFADLPGVRVAEM